MTGCDCDWLCNPFWCWPWRDKTTTEATYKIASLRTRRSAPIRSVWSRIKFLRVYACFQVKGCCIRYNVFYTLCFTPRINHIWQFLRSTLSSYSGEWILKIRQYCFEKFTNKAMHLLNFDFVLKLMNDNIASLWLWKHCNWWVVTLSSTETLHQSCINCNLSDICITVCYFVSV